MRHSESERLLVRARLYNLRALCGAAGVNYRRIVNYKAGRVRRICPADIERIENILSK